MFLARFNLNMFTSKKRLHKANVLPVNSAEVLILEKRVLATD